MPAAPREQLGLVGSAVSGFPAVGSVGRPMLVRAVCAVLWMFRRLSACLAGTRLGLMAPAHSLTTAHSPMTGLRVEPRGSCSDAPMAWRLSELGDRAYAARL